MIAPIGLAPSDELAVILQWAAFGALVGTGFAARMRIRGSRGDPVLPPMMWALLAGGIVGLYVLGNALGWW